MARKEAKYRREHSLKWDSRYNRVKRLPLNQTIEEKSLIMSS